MTNPWRGLKDLPSESWILFFTTLLNRCGTMVLPFLVIYMTHALGYSPTEAGFVLASYGFGGILAAPLSGRLSDIVGPARVMGVSLLLTAALIFVFPFVKNYSLILALTVLWSLFGEAFRPAAFVYITNTVSPEKRKTAFALNRLAINIGMSIGPAIGGLLVGVSFRPIFFVDGLTSLFAGLLLFFSVRNRSFVRPPASAILLAPKKFSERFAILSDRSFGYFLAVILLVSFVFFQELSTMPLYLVHDLHLPIHAYGMMFVVNTVLIITLEVPLNAWMETWPYNRSLAWGAFLFCGGFAALAFANGFVSVLGTVVIWTFGEMILLPASAAYVADIAPERKRGQYMGLYSMTFAIAFAVAPLIGIGILENFGGQALWIGCGVIGLIGTYFMSRIPRSVAKPQSHE